MRLKTKKLKKMIRLRGLRVLQCLVVWCGVLQCAVGNGEKLNKEIRLCVS